ncbi:hypothetical protein HAX54_006817 [Datura stramonium]|uniref:Uncharacterized protein n=1 Tax=Datura stramonium TaxID=4076 RepID=A0ABS8RUP4_DATST|nr:hypothetical protein [Datura stramonium]
MVVKQAMAAWGDTSSESNQGGENPADTSMYAQEDGPSKFDSIFALMAQSDADENEEVCMHGEEPGSKDVNRILTHQKFKALRELSGN